MSVYLESDIEQTILQKLVDKGYQYNPNSDWLTGRPLDSFVDTQTLLLCLEKINSTSNINILQEAIKKISVLDNLNLFEKNETVHKMLVDGVTIEEHNARVNPHIRYIDFDNIDNNLFEVYSQLRFREKQNTRIPDIVVYINGLPLVIFEIKGIAERDDTMLEQAYQQLGSNSEENGYRYDIPTLFAYNAFCVISDGATSKVGTITSDFARYSEWKSKNGETSYDKHYAYKLDVLIDGLLDKPRLLEIVKNYLFFIHNDNKKVSKILSQYHQFFGIKKAKQAIIKAIKPSGDGKAGLLWHTQGSGKSFSMVMLVGTLIKDYALGNPTVVILTDRNDLDNQLFATFYAAKEFLRTTPIQVSNRKELVEILSKQQQGGIIFSTIQKFDKDNIVSNMRHNIVVLSDEAHRSHYGVDEKIQVHSTKDSSSAKMTTKFGYAKYIRDALPNATFFGFTGTPVADKDKSTEAIFGQVVDIYDMTQSIQDGSTVKLFYESRLAKVWLDEQKLKEVEEFYKELETDSIDDEVLEASKKSMSRMEVVVGNFDRLDLLAKDILSHYNERKLVLNGKAMIVCMSRKIAFDLYTIMLRQDNSLVDKLKVVVTESNKDTRQEREVFGDKSYRQELAVQFKKSTSEIKIVIVVDMWLTGFDVTDLDVMYIDKPMKSHNLMQAIARVNRVHQGKESGLIVDYIGINNALKKALNDFTARDKQFNLQDVQKVAVEILQECLSILDEMFFNIDKKDFFDDIDKKRFESIQKGADWVLSQQRKKDFLDTTKRLKDIFVVAFGVTEHHTKQVVNYYLAVRLFIKKLIVQSDGKFDIASINKRVSDLITEAIKGDEVQVLTQLKDRQGNVWDFLSDENIAKLRASNPPHIFIKIIEKLLKEAIAEYRGYNLVKAKEYSERLKRVLEVYNDREDDAKTELTILSLVEFSTEMVRSEEEAKTKGLSGRERAFYDALATEKSAKEMMGDEILKIIAKELKDIVEEYGTVDWSKKQDTQAKMRMQIKRLLKKYKYPPEYEESAIDRVVGQAEYMM